MSLRNRMGPDNPLYRSGKSHDGSGYVILSSKTYGEHRNRREHQVVAEAMLGRRLLRSEVVHHLNGDKADNRPENLIVMDRRDHQRVHLGRGRLVACRICGAEKWHSPKMMRGISSRGYACQPCGGRWA